MSHLQAAFTRVAAGREGVVVGKDNHLLPYMKHLGTGKTGSRDLTRDNARGAMEAILQGSFHPVTFGAFFQSLRYKGESVEEIAGLSEALQEAISQFGFSVPGNTVDCAGSYDGKQRTLNVGIPAALVTAAAGFPVLLHGAREVPTKYGMTTSHVLEALKIQWTRSPATAAEDLRSLGIAYLHQSMFHPRLHSLLPLRAAMGKRTILNTIEPLLNPLNARIHVGGFFHDAYAELVCRTCAVTPLGFTRVLLVKGIEGSDELRPGRMMFCELKDGEVKTHTTDSAALGCDSHISDLSLAIENPATAAAENALRIRELLEGEDRDGPGYRNSVLLNAAVRLYAAGAADSIEQALPIASQAFESGRAAALLQSWQTACPSRG